MDQTEVLQSEGANCSAGTDMGQVNCSWISCQAFVNKRPLLRGYDGFTGHGAQMRELCSADCSARFALFGKAGARVPSLRGRAPVKRVKSIVDQFSLNVISTDKPTTDRGATRRF